MTFDQGAGKGPDVSKVPRVGPDVSKVPHVGARPGATPPSPPAGARVEPRVEPRVQAAAAQPAAAPKPSEQQFRQSLDGLARSLGERAARHPDPVAEAAARRAAVLAQIRAEDRRLKLVLGVSGAVVAAVCLAAAIVFVAAPFGPRAEGPAVEAKAQPISAEPPPPTVQAAAVTPTPEPPPAPAPVSSPPVQMATAEPAPAPAPPPVADPPAVPPPAASPPAPSPLARDDIKEIQARLAAFGFNAGPADGNAGRMTQGAILNYQQQRGLPQTGKPDRALLDQLRDDPAPKVAVAQQPPPPSPRSIAQASSPSGRAANATNMGSQRRNDGLDFVRDADARISRWLQSLSR